MPIRADSESWQQALDDAHARINAERAKSGGAPLSLDQCPILQHFRAYPDLTWADGMQRVLNDPAVKPNWCFVIRTIFRDWLSDALKLGLSRKIARSGNPMAAARLYLREATLSAEEDQELASAFQGALPSVERDLNDGTVTRTKRQ